MIGRAVNRFARFMGPARLRALYLLIATTGLLSLMLNVIVNDFPWVRPVQSVLALLAIVGSGVLIGGRLEPGERGRWAAILAPALGALILATTVLQQYSLVLIGGALGWVVAALLIFRPRMPVGYRAAIRALRKGDLETAVRTMDEVIRDDPETPEHYRFRAELLRLWGKLERARRDYQKMAELEPQSAVAFNGLAEVELQAGNYGRALEAGQRALELAPQEWVAAYNLGMIEDRLGQSEDAIAHLGHAIALGVPEGRHRLLIHLYLARAHMRTGGLVQAQAALVEMKKLRSAVEEWQKILEDEQAEVLRRVLGADIEAADQLIRGERMLDLLEAE